MGKNVVCFLPISCCIATSNSLRTDAQGGGSQVTLRLIPPSFVSEGCGDCSNSVLLSISGIHIWTMSIAKVDCYHFVIIMTIMFSARPWTYILS